MKIWVLVTMPYSGGRKKLIRGFDTEAEARRIAAIVDECDPRFALDIEEIEVDIQQEAALRPPGTTWWQSPLFAGFDPGAPGSDRTVWAAHSEDGFNFIPVSRPEVPINHGTAEQSDTDSHTENF